MAPRPGKTRGIVEFGDFQTPVDLAEKSMALLLRRGMAPPRAIIEPTCGRGAFLVAAAKAFPETAKIVGLDINTDHLAAARDATEDCKPSIELSEGDFFTVDWSAVVRPVDGPWLILGNPPWVTNAGLGAISSRNLPEKSNFKGHKGLDAMTGKANFDISEWMLLRYLDWLKDSSGTIAVLCKSAVARKILAFAWATAAPIESAEIFKIDALAQFGAAVDACLFVVKIGPRPALRQCLVFHSYDADAPSQRIGFDGTQLIADAALFERRKGLAGVDPKYVWRSGIKHDCSQIMELRRITSGYENGIGEIVEIEDEMTFPMLKSSDVGNGRLASRGVMVVTQKMVGQSTDHIQIRYPTAWRYLNTHGDRLDARGSSIYRRSPRFSIFGVGGYTFAPWKVAISGFYKHLDFRVVGPEQGKPVVFDDTVYFLSCSSQEEAKFIQSLLQSEPAQEFLQSIVHWDEKRPITVSVLKRLSLRKLAELVDQTGRYESFSGALAFSTAA